jgi:pimeloyl-ACP methyl ester carboxylesterase
MTTSTDLPIAEGPGSVSGVPELPEGFAGTFSSHYVDAGELRLHAVIGGEGPPLLLIHGWPQTWYAWRMVMPALARDFEVIAVDQRGIGLSDTPDDGYDLGTLARDMVGAMETLGHKRFAIYGTDTGMPIAYALAADDPELVDRLVVSEAFIPGISPSPPLVVPGPLNDRLWHIGFNRLAPELNEELVRGKEAVYFGAEFAASAGTPLPDYALQYYVETLASRPDALRGSFGWYRAIDATIAQNEERKDRRLNMPVLGIGGALSGREMAAEAMKLVADDVQTVVLPDSGHRVAEEAPEALLDAVTEFLAPYREGAVAHA